MPRALFLSPHLDDVAFSCSATLIQLLETGWDIQLVTIFTASVENPRGFALRCQTDKGIAPDVDYMALRRAEDAEFCRIAGVENTSYWEFPEAPHRGYDSAPELFAGMKTGDEIWRDIADRLRDLGEFDLIFAPQGLGNHVDHLQLIRAVSEAGLAPQTRWYCDTPYAIRQTDALHSALLPPDLDETFVPFGMRVIAQKVAGCCAYESQIGFQFGGAIEVARKLADFHRAEAVLGDCTPFAERFLTPSGDEFFSE